MVVDKKQIGTIAYELDMDTKEQYRMSTLIEIIHEQGFDENTTHLFDKLAVETKQSPSTIKKFLKSIINKNESKINKVIGEDIRSESNKMTNRNFILKLSSVLKND